MDDLPSLKTLEDLSHYVDQHPSKARKCWHLTSDGQCLVEYPFLGKPPPHQPRVCGFQSSDGSICGIGGHNARRHLLLQNITSKALAHGVWIIRNMETLGFHHTLRHILVFVDLLCGLEGRRRHYKIDATADIQALLVIFGYIIKWKDNIHKVPTQCPQRRRQRSSILLLNETLLLLSSSSATAPSPVFLQNRDIIVAHVPSPKLVIFLFPLSNLETLCIDAFKEQTFTPGKIPILNKDVVCCHTCGIPGHNQATCKTRTTATHVAIALALLLDPYKTPRISTKTASLTLFHCYQVIVGMLHRWVSDKSPWKIGGTARIKVFVNTPHLLLKLFNHTLASIKTCPKFGPSIRVVERPERFMVEAAHAYDDDWDDDTKLQHETDCLQELVEKVVEEHQDDFMGRWRPMTMMSPEKQASVNEMISSAARTDPRVQQDLSMFSFDDLTFD